MTPSPKPETRRDASAARTMDAVFDRYVERIYSFLYRRLGNREDAEDMTSEVFVKASSELDITRPEASIASWLFTVARNELNDHWRRHYRFGALLPFDDVRAHSSPEPSHVESEPGGAEERLEPILAALPDRYRRVLELRFLQNLTIRETAEAMGVTQENVKVMQHRALARAVSQHAPPSSSETVREVRSEPSPARSTPSKVRL